jgi:hypothetical protein
LFASATIYDAEKFPEIVKIKFDRFMKPTPHGAEKRFFIVSSVLWMMNLKTNGIKLMM